MKSLTIAIDGPAASGKSTTARLLARKLGYLHVDTGAMYRALTLKVLREGVSPEDEEAVTKLAMQTEITQRLVDGEVRTFLDGEDVTHLLRSPEVDRFVSVVSAYPGVRKRLVELQRKLAEKGGVVLEGRDIGTVVLPDADIKIFMTASLEERAKRRAKELRERGVEVDLEEIKREIERRDRLDSTRKNSPLKKAEDAIVVDTTNLTIEEQVEVILEEIKRRYGED